MYDEIHPAVRRLMTICRCNNIKYGTIALAIESGACSIDEIARKTTATTGLCGGTCTPRVTAMLEELSEPSEASPETDADAWWIRK